MKHLKRNDPQKIEGFDLAFDFLRLFIVYS